MLGSEYNWLLSPARSMRDRTVRLARSSFLTPAVATFCLAGLLAAPTLALSPSAATVAAPAAATLKETAQSELPRTLLRLWILVPHLLPQR